MKLTGNVVFVGKPSLSVPKYFEKREIILAGSSSVQAFQARLIPQKFGALFACTKQNLLSPK